jgi:hypothetical protein
MSFGITQHFSSSPLQIFASRAMLPHMYALGMALFQFAAVTEGKQ